MIVGVDVAVRGHLARLYVDPSWWGPGVGARLYDTGLWDLTRSCQSSPAVSARRRSISWPMIQQSVAGWS
jgi:GNAT superfamily N-acetyltransferase